MTILSRHMKQNVSYNIAYISVNLKIAQYLIINKLSHVKYMQYLYVSIQLWKCDFYNFGQNNGRYYTTYYTHYFSKMSALRKCNSTSHGLINYIDTKSKCHWKIDCKGTWRQLFIRVLSDSTLPLTCVKVQIIQCVAGRGREVLSPVGDHIL